MKRIFVFGLLFLLCGCQSPTFLQNFTQNKEIGFNPNSTSKPSPIATPKSSPLSSPTIKPTNSPKSELTPIDDKWEQYTNHQLGFTIKVPKQVVDHSDTSGRMEEVEIIEDGDVVYFTSVHDYNYLNIQTNLANKNTSNLEKLAGEPITWAILIQPAKDLDEVKQFISNRYGSKCALEKLNDTTYGYQKVQILSTPPSDEQSSCWMNFAYSIMYDSKKQILANWDAGQSYHFELYPGEWGTNDIDQHKSVDYIMAESFRFL